MSHVRPAKNWRPSSDENLSRFMREVRNFPLLTAKEEARLAYRWRDHRDPDAARQLVGSHQRLVIKMATNYRGYGLPLSDVISEANIGLMQAINKFDPDRGFRLSTYAMWWIRAAINDYVLRSSSVVKSVTNEHHKKLFFNLRRLKAKHQKPDQTNLTPEAVTAIAEELGVSESDVLFMDARLGVRDLSINGPAREDSDATWQDLLVDEADDQETMVVEADEFDKRRMLMRKAMAKLDDRERHIFTERRLKENPPKLGDLGEHYGISRERVRQIEYRAFDKLKRLMNSDMALSPAL